MLTDKEKSDLRAHNATDKSTAIAQQISRIHAAVNDGTLDRDTVNDALERLTELTGDHKRDSFADFTGQKGKDSYGNGPQGVATTAPSAPQVTGQPDPHPNPNSGPGFNPTNNPDRIKNQVDPANPTRNQSSSGFNPSTDNRADNNPNQNFPNRPVDPQRP